MKTTAAKKTGEAATPRRRSPQWAVANFAKTGTSEIIPDRYSSKALERALDALEAFDSTSEAMSLKELSQATGQPESSLYRTLTTLQKRDYLLQNRNGTYQLTTKVLQGRMYEKAERVKSVARPYLEELGRRFDETASLAYLFTDYIQVLDTVETFHPIRVTNRAGRIIPPHCSSMGKIILSYQTNDIADRMLETYGLVRRTQHSISDRQALREEMERSKSAGYSVDREESMLGGTCYGAPIFTASGAVVAALSVSTPIQRLTPEREVEIRDAVMSVAAQISAALR
ncbi:MAG: transcriptional regulator, IclR family [Acidobacteriaceae bacterium]|nr:transcriptional regulator, IclR family [Acidobacteriaceae bacterium]